VPADFEVLLLANLHAAQPKSLQGQVLHYLASQWSKPSATAKMGATAST
jgi:hypothetical protein